MTEETAIERLDYSKAPPGSRGGDADFISHAWENGWKRHSDPPGLLVSQRMGHPSRLVHKVPEVEARAAAWTWYDRRLALADVLDLEYMRPLVDGGITWPRCLTWTDEQVAEVERWLRDSTAEMPEVLRTSEATTAAPCRRCTECTGQEHHWLSEPDLQDEEADFEEGVNDYVYKCKHCRAHRPYDPDEDEDEFESPEEIEERRAAGECVCDEGLLSIPCPRCDGGVM